MNLRRKRRFPTTRWSLIERAVRSDSSAAEALQKICEAYWYPVYVFVRRRGYDTDAAADLTQSFFTDLIERRSLRSADADRGRLRNFLLASVEHFLSNERDRAHALKRGAQHFHVPIDTPAAEGSMRHELLAESDPELSFARSWAMTLVRRCLEELRQELAREGRSEDYERFRWMLCDAPARGEYGELEIETGLDQGALRVLVHRLRLRFRAIVRQEVERMCGHTAVDEEIHFLIDAVSR